MVTSSFDPVPAPQPRPAADRRPQPRDTLVSMPRELDELCDFCACGIPHPHAERL